MSLSAILESIRASGVTRVGEIESLAQAQAREILVNARLEAQLIEDDACTRAEAPAYRERARILHRARLEALRAIGNERESLIDSALEQTRGRLAGMRSDDEYATIMCHLLQEALNELRGPLGEVGNACLEADPRDRPLLESLFKGMGLEIQVNYVLNCWGGLVAKSEDGRVVVINTLEDRLDRATPYLRRYLAAYFEDDHWQISETEIVQEGKKVASAN